MDDTGLAKPLSSGIGPFSSTSCEHAAHGGRFSSGPEAGLAEQETARQTNHKRGTPIASGNAGTLIKLVNPVTRYKGFLH